MKDGKRVVLIIDDDTAPLQFLVRFFESNGWTVRSSVTVPDALHKLSHHVDLVVTDFDMPVMNGADFMSLVRKRFKTVPVIGISGLSTIARLYGSHVFDGFLVKPFRLGDLRTAVGNIFKAVVEASA